MELTGIERIQRILKHQPVDRIGVYEHFWSDTQRAWTEQGFLKPGELLEDHFHYDLVDIWAFNYVADLDFVPQVIEETEETILQRDGNVLVSGLHNPDGAPGRIVDLVMGGKVRLLCDDRILGEYPDDRPFVEVAASGEADALVTSCPGTNGYLTTW